MLQVSLLSLTMALPGKCRGGGCPKSVTCLRSQLGSAKAGVQPRMAKPPSPGLPRAQTPIPHPDSSHPLGLTLASDLKSLLMSTLGVGVGLGLPQVILT